MREPPSTTSTGPGRDYAWMQEELRPPGPGSGGPPGIEVREYIYDMPLVMAAADVVLCRAGASTISELTAIAKPSMLVPSPNVTANHQEKNARVLADQGARGAAAGAGLLRQNALYDGQRTICCGTGAAGMTWSGP